MTAENKRIMEMTTKAALLRAADIIDKITADDVLDMQAKLLAEGVSLENVAKLDRAMVASAHLRSYGKRD